MSGRLRTRTRAVSLVAALMLLAGCGAGSSEHRPARDSAPGPRSSSLASATRHYEYVFLDGSAYVYDIDNGQQLVQQLSLPGISGIRGVAADIHTHMLYISHGGDGDGNGNGSLAKYDLLTNRIAWDHAYDRGIDSFAISNNGKRIYMPDGELSTNGIWSVLDAGTGRVIGQIQGGLGPHNTIVGLGGRHVYLGGRNNQYLDVASTRTNRVIRRIGPLRSGVRPFTINGHETLAYSTATGFLGFQVSSIRTGRVLYSERFGPRFGWNQSAFPVTAPSHGITLSPDERQLWVVDSPNAYVHVFDVTGVPRRAPRRIADIKLSNSFTGSQSACSYDCGRDGWLQTSSSGCFVYVGDSGDVLSTTGFRVLGYLPALRNSREFLEIDWRGGVPVASTTRTGLGHFTGRRRPHRPACR